MFKKCIMFILIFFLFLFFNVVDVNAADGQLSAGDIEMECVYDNGITISAYYSGGAYGMIATEFKLSNKISAPYSNGMNAFYNEATFAKQILDSGTCPSRIYYGVVRQWNKDGTANVAFSLFYRQEDSSKMSCDVVTTYTNTESGLVTGRECTEYTTFDKAFFTSKIIAGFEPHMGYFDVYEIEKDSALRKRAQVCYTNTDDCFQFSFNLVSERVYFTGDVEAAGQWAFKSEGEQAASKVIYAKVYKYTIADGNAKYFIEKDDNITSVSGIGSISTPGKHYLCLKTSDKEIATGKNDVGFSFSSTRHTAHVYTEKPNSCYEGYTLYKEVDWSEAEEAGKNPTSICDIIPNTALILAEIVNYARIIVPALLIIYTGIDISRIVISGNIAEELPKRRKNIIIRFVIALVFFFLPLLVQVIVASTYGVDFGDISCIWT